MKNCEIGERIPKVIHYCWFGGNPLPELAIKCIGSWKKYCPDYEIKEWNESNYYTDNVYARETLEQKKWAFYSDFARLDIIYKNGGIYLDTDVEVIRGLDDLLKNICFLGIEKSGYIATGLGFGAVKRNENIKRMLKEYDNIHFILPNGMYDFLPCPERNTYPFMQYGFSSKAKEIQEICGATIYPPEYFSPLNYETGEMNVTENTYSIHHYTASWQSEADRKYYNWAIALQNKFGYSAGKRLIRIIDFPHRIKKKISQLGFYGALNFVVRKIKKK